ncbi:hypothetical protein EDB83DRAFT_83129 [Lactarius deliciosus]|nr:hypothetical protein EDB83DRAFT_83129 [Lactarius deliciosus]
MAAMACRHAMADHKRTILISRPPLSKHIPSTCSPPAWPCTAACCSQVDLSNECTKHAAGALYTAECNAILCFLCYRSPMGKPSHPISSIVRSHVSHYGLQYRRAQYPWYCQRLSDPSSGIDSGPVGYGESVPLLSTDSSHQSYYTTNTSPPSPISTCSSDTMSFPYTVTSIHSYKSNKNVSHSRRERPPPAASSSQGHVPDPHQPPRRMETGWMLRFRTTEGVGSPAQAWLFYFALVLFPLWWVGAVWRMPKTRVVVGGMNMEELAPPDDSQIAFDARSWRFRCRVMAAISLLTYVPLITLVAIFESR